MKGMILAAGLGTRLRPSTDTLPKALVSVAGRPMIAHAIDALVAAGVNEIVVNVHAHADLLAAWLGDRSLPFPIRVSREETLLGTGGGISHARRYLEEEEFFLVHNVDNLTDGDLGKLIADHRAHRPLATLAVNRRVTLRPVLADASMLFRGKEVWMHTHEYPLPGVPVDLFGFCGIYILDARIFRFLRDELSDIFDAFLAAMKQGESIMCHDIGDAYWTDLGTLYSIRRHERRIGKS